MPMRNGGASGKSGAFKMTPTPPRLHPPRDMPALWLFDFDKTLANLRHHVDWPKARTELEAMLRRAGAAEELFERIPPGKCLPLYEAYMAELRSSANSANSTGASGGDAILRRASRIIEKYELAGVAKAEPLEGAVELLRILGQRRIPAAIVTSNSSKIVSRWLARFRVRPTIRAIVGRDSLLPLKPAPAMIEHALELAGARPRDAIFVGDTEGDLIAAHEAKVAFIAIAADDAARDHFLALGAQRIFRSPAALAIHMNLALAPPPYRGALRRLRVRRG